MKVSSQKLDKYGEPLIQFDILGDGKVNAIRMGSEVLSKSEIDERQEALAWTIIYFFVCFFAFATAGLYIYFRQQNEKTRKNETFLEFLADKLEDPASWKRENESNTLQSVEL